MKVCVIGTGAMGSIYGSFFAKNNFDVLCYDVWDEHVDAINNEGLRVSGISGDHTEKKIRATTNFNELKDRDLYIIATKGDAVGSVASKLADFDLSSAIVLTIQNGLGAAERIEKFMPTENVLLGVAQGFGASIKAPGHAHHNGMSMIRIGEINGGLTDRLTTIVNAWEEAGFTSKGFEDIQQLIWEKFICNVMCSAPCAAFECNIGELFADKDRRQVALGCLIEAHEIGIAKGIHFSFDDVLAYGTKFAELMPNANPSMRLDHLAGRKSEIDAINGMVPMLGKELGIATPYNDTVVALVRSKEASFH